MENLEVLGDRQQDNKLWEFNSDILDIVSKKINTQKLIDEWILEVSSEVQKYIDGVWYNIEDILKLAWMYKNFDNLEKIEFTLIWNKWIKISMYGDKYLISRELFPSELTIRNSHIDTDKSKISWFRSFLEEVEAAKEKGYKTITCYAAWWGWLQEDKQIWFYYWLLLWFEFDKNWSNYSHLESILRFSNKKWLINCNSLDYLFDLKDANWKYIGIEFWKKYGQWFYAKFDLNDNSNSIKRLNKYILSKKQSDPDKYNDINVIR